MTQPHGGGDFEGQFDVSFEAEGAIGFELAMRSLACASVAASGPAAAAGVRRGDVLIAVSGLAVTGMSSEETLALLLAKVRPMTLTFARPRAVDATTKEAAAEAARAGALLATVTATATAAAAAAGAGMPRKADAGSSAAGAGPVEARVPARHAEALEVALPAAPDGAGSDMAPLSRPTALASLRARLDVVGPLAMALMTAAVLCSVSGPLSALSCSFVFVQGLLWNWLAQSTARLVHEATRPLSSEGCCCGFRWRGALDDMRLLAIYGALSATLEVVAVQAAAWTTFARRDSFSSTLKQSNSCVRFLQSGILCCTASCAVPASENFAGSTAFFPWLLFAAGQSLTCSLVNVCLSVLSLRIVDLLQAAVDKLPPRAALGARLEGGAPATAAREWVDGSGDTQNRIEELEHAVHELRGELRCGCCGRLQRLVLWYSGAAGVTAAIVISSIGASYGVQSK